MNLEYFAVDSQVSVFGAGIDELVNLIWDDVPCRD